MRRGVAAVCAAACLVGAADARGQATSVVGAGSYNEAPVLEDGIYTDTLRGSETNVYAVELEPGQRMNAEVTLVGRGFEGNAGIVSLDAFIDTPGRTAADGEFEGVRFVSTQDGRTVVNRVRGPVAEDSLEAIDDEEFPAAGRWYLRVTVEDPNGEVGPLEFPIDVEIEVEGTPTGETEPPPIPEEEPDEVEPDPIEEDVPEESSENISEESDSDAGTLAIIGAGGLALGALGGFTLFGRKRKTG